MLSVKKRQARIDQLLDLGDLMLAVKLKNKEEKREKREKLKELMYRTSKTFNKLGLHPAANLVEDYYFQINQAYLMQIEGDDRSERLRNQIKEAHRTLAIARIKAGWTKKSTHLVKLAWRLICSIDKKSSGWENDYYDNLKDFVKVVDHGNMNLIDKAFMVFLWDISEKGASQWD